MILNNVSNKITAKSSEKKNPDTLFSVITFQSYRFVSKVCARVLRG